mgnify:CR=1 FL=1
MSDIKFKTRRVSFFFINFCAASLLACLPLGNKIFAQTIVEAMALAYQNNPKLKAARAGMRASDEGVPQEIANWRPDVSVSADMGFKQVTNTNLSGSTRDQTRHPKGFGLDLSQSLIRGGELLPFDTMATKKAENTIRAARARLIATEQTVLTDAVSAYMSVFQDRSVLKLNINNEQVLNRQLDATRDRFEVGEITRTDVFQAEARLAKAVADRIQSEGDLRVSMAAYNNIFGQPPKDNLQIPRLPTDLPRTKEEALKLAVSYNPEVVGANYDRDAAVNNVKDVRAEFLPDLDLASSWTRDYQSGAECCQTTTKTLTLNLSIPLYQQGVVSSRLRKARQEVSQKTLQADQQRRDAQESASAAWEGLNTARARVKAFDAQINASKIALEGVEREAAVGSRTVLDVLDAEQELLDSRVSHVRAQRSEVVATYELLGSVGRMTARALKLPVTFYEPRDNYEKIRGKWFGWSD